VDGRVAAGPGEGNGGRHGGRGHGAAGGERVGGGDETSSIGIL